MGESGEAKPCPIESLNGKPELILAWEQQPQPSQPQPSQGKIFVGVAHRGLVSTAWAWNFEAAMAPYLSRILRSAASNAPIDTAREMMAQASVNQAEWLYFLDSDIHSAPGTLQALLDVATKFNYPIVSALYYRRWNAQLDTELMKTLSPSQAEVFEQKKKLGIPVFTPAMWRDLYTEMSGEQKLVGWRPILDGEFQPGQILDIQGVLPMGCCLIRTEIFRKLPQPWFYWAANRPNPPGGVSDGIACSEDFWFCVPPSTYIYGLNVKRIDTIKIGEKVLTHKGSLRKVTRVMKRWYEGPMIRVRCKYGLPLYLTPEHPILIGKEFGSNDLRWKLAKELTVKDKVYFPKNARDGWAEKRSLHLRDHVCFEGWRHENGHYWFTRTHKTAAKIPASMPLVPEVLRFLGYYVAEGSSCANGCSSHFTFNADESDYVDEVVSTGAEYFNAEANVFEPKGRHVAEVTFSSKILARLLSNLCGKGARNKHLPPFFMHLEKNQLRELLEGVWRGDGSLNRNGERILSTCSERLAHEYRYAHVSRLSKWMSIQRHGEGFTLTEIAGSKGWKYYKENLNNYRIEIDEVARIPYSGDVWNLEVEGANSYVAEGVSVHNCMNARKHGLRLLVATGILVKHESTILIGGEGRIGVSDEV